MQDPGVATGLARFFADSNEDWAGGPLALPLHIHVLDATGRGVLIEAPPGGGSSVRVYDTNAATNEPAWPEMEANVTQWFEGARAAGGMPPAVQGLGSPVLRLLAWWFLGTAVWPARPRPATGRPRTCPPAVPVAQSRRPSRA